MTTCLCIQYEYDRENIRYGRYISKKVNVD